MQLPFEIVDVFAERPLQGNQLAVFLPPAPLPVGRMQALACEMGFSESTFVDAAPGAGAARVRIFTPAAELPFAGHPVLGTAAVLHARAADAGAARVRLAVAAGDLDVQCAGDGLFWLEAPPARRDGECDRGELVRRLALRDDQLTHDPFPVFDVGPRFVLVELADLDALSHLRPDAELFGWLRTHCGALGLYAFTSDAYGPEAHYAARMFFLAGQVREDPATGSAAICLAEHLRQAGRDPGDVVEVEQGHEVQRPSRIHLAIGDRTRLGGRVFRIGRGVIDVD
jgi:trans-2,3-dihydro-3-hydroxyanthranilate isomerase